MREKILVIEDEEKILHFLRRGLAYEGYQVETAIDGSAGLELAGENPPDLVILDWMLPGLNGLEVCRRLRAAGSIPILMLTAKDSISDRVRGLDAGADDYLVKPFALDEVLARIRALLRRAKPEGPEVLAFSDLKLDTGTHQAFRGRPPSSLRPRNMSCSNSSCAIRGRCSPVSRSTIEFGAMTLVESRTSSRSTCATCARRPKPAGERA